jgi:hypothetical protein
MAELRDEIMAMDATPAARLEVIHSQFVFHLPEAALHHPTVESHLQQPAQRGSLFARHAIGYEIWFLT